MSDFGNKYRKTNVEQPIVDTVSFGSKYRKGSPNQIVREEIKQPTIYEQYKSEHPIISGLGQVQESIINPVIEGAKNVAQHPFITARGVGEGLISSVMGLEAGLANVLGAKKASDYISQNRKAVETILSEQAKSKNAESANEVGKFIGEQFPYLIASELTAGVVSPATARIIPSATKLSTASKIGKITNAISNIAGFSAINQLITDANATKDERLNQLKTDVLTIGAFEGVGAGFKAFQNYKWGKQAQKFVSELKTNTPKTIPEIEATVNNIKNEALKETGKPIEQILKEETGTPIANPLIQEAKKYKSAEEFVKAQTNAQHGTNADFAEFKKVDPSKGEAIYLSDKGQVKASAISSRSGKLMDVAVDESRVKTFDPRNPNTEINSIVQDAINKVYGKGKYRFDPETPVATKNIINKVDDVLQAEVIRQASKKGYNDFRFYEPSTHEYSRAITDNSLIKTKSQLTDIWNEANKVTEKTIKVPQSQLPVGGGKTQFSGLEARIKSTLDNVSEDNKPLISEYNQMNKADQIKRAAEYVSLNPEEAMSVLRGEKQPPKGLLKNSIFVAMTQTADENVELATKLASLESTRFGQEISILSEVDTHSPVKYISNLVKTKIEALGGRAKLKEIKNTEIKNIKKNISKNNLVKEDWDAFVASIMC